MINYAKANPGKLRWATAAARGGPHIATEAALRKEGVKATYVPFGGGSEAVTALLGNHIEMLIDAYYAPFLESGKISPGLILEAARIASEEASPRTSLLRGSDVYRREMIRLYLTRTVQKLLEEV